MSRARIEHIIKEVKALLSEVFGERLKGLILYGSYARGDAADDSDIDLLAILGNVTDPFGEREKYFESLWELDLKYDTVISVIPCDDVDYKSRNIPLYLNARKEGVWI